MSAEINLTSANFETEVIKSSIPVLVDFWAEWCMPCKMIAPTIDQLATDFAGRLKVGKVNVDQENELAAQHNIVSIPTLLVFKD
ncbi:MAG: thioredoxin, partial [Treponemataceae bacterium]